MYELRCGNYLNNNFESIMIAISPSVILLEELSQIYFMSKRLIVENQEEFFDCHDNFDLAIFKVVEIQDERKVFLYHPHEFENSFSDFGESMMKLTNMKGFK